MFLSEDNRETVVLAIGSIISVSGFFLGNALISIGMIVMFMAVFINTGYNQTLKFKHSNLYSYGLILFFGVLLLSGLWTEDTHTFLRAIKRKLPLLILPLAFISIKRFSKKIYLQLLQLLFVVISAINLKLFSEHFIDIDQLYQMYKEGRVINTPMMHIRYSLLCVYNIFVGIYLIQKLKINTISKAIIALGVVFGFVFVHLLAVRTGMVALYTAIISLLVGYIAYSRKYTIGIVATVAFTTGLILAINHIPTLKNKWNYTIYSIQEMKKNTNIEVLSDSYRIASVGAGIEMGNSSPIIGVGLGDVKPLTQKYVVEHYPSLAHEVFTPQSQYVMAYASTGLIGLLILIIVSMIPIISGIKYFDINAIAISSLLVGSYLIEQTLETQLGTAIAIILSLWSYKNLPQGE